MVKKWLRAGMLMTLIFMMALLPVSAMAQTTVTDMYEFCEALMPGDDGKISDSIVLANDIRWQEVDFCYDDTEESDAIFVFRHNVEVDLGGHTFEIVVGSHKLIEVIGNVSATIKNGKIQFGSKSEYDEADGLTYTTNGSITSEYVKFTDKGSASRGKLTLDNVHLDMDVCPQNPLNHKENIVDMNGGDALNIINGSFIRFCDKGEYKHTSVFVRAAGQNNVLYMEDSGVSAIGMRSGIVGSCTVKNVGAVLNIYDMSEYYFDGDGLTVEADCGEFTGYASLGIQLKNSAITLKNGSRIWQDDGAIPLTVADERSRIKTDGTSWLELSAKIQVPEGTTLDDYLNTEDGIGFRTDRITSIGKMHTVRFTDGVAGKEIFPDEVYQRVYMESAPKGSGVWKDKEGFLGFTPDPDNRLKGDTTFTAIWASTGKNPIVVEPEMPKQGSASPVELVPEVIQEALKNKCDILIKKDGSEVTLNYEFVKAVAIEDETLVLPDPQPVSAKELLGEKRMEVLEGKKAMVAFSMEMMIGEKKITDFNGQQQEFAIPFDPPAGTTVDQFALMYIGENGETETMAITYRDGHSYAMFSHFSDYVVVRGNAQVDLPQTGDNSSLMLWAGLLLISLCAFAAGRKAHA